MKPFTPSGILRICLVGTAALALAAPAGAHNGSVVARYGWGLRRPSPRHSRTTSWRSTAGALRRPTRSSRSASRWPPAPTAISWCNTAGVRQPRTRNCTPRTTRRPRPGAASSFRISARSPRPSRAGRCSRGPRPAADDGTRGSTPSTSTGDATRRSTSATANGSRSIEKGPWGRRIKQHARAARIRMTGKRRG
jgi:hypothetical protein